MSALREAAHAVGDARLAAFLGVEPPLLRGWLGSAEIPLEVFLACLDVIADGPFAPREAPVRVAVIRQEVDGHHPRGTQLASMRDTTTQK